MDSLSFNKNKYVFTSMPSIIGGGKTASAEKKDQVLLFLKELELYNVIFKDLVNMSLREKDRNLALNIAYYIMEDDRLSEKIDRKKDLPLRELCPSIRINKSKIESIKDYIIAYYIIISDPRLKIIQDNLKIVIKEKHRPVNSPINKKYEIHKGIALKVTYRHTYIITSMGEFMKINDKTRVNLGDYTDGREALGIKRFKLIIAIFMVLMIIIGAGTMALYNRTDRIIVVNATSNIKLHVNKFNKVIYVYSPTEKGSELLTSLEIKNKDIDYSLSKIFEYCVQNNMLDTSKNTLVTIVGKPLKYGELKETNDVITKNNIPILINNAGNKQSLPKDEEQ